LLSAARTTIPVRKWILIVQKWTLKAEGSLKNPKKSYWPIFCSLNRKITHDLQATIKFQEGMGGGS
jgi:hypothetical protein